MVQVFYYLFISWFGLSSIFLIGPAEEASISSLYYQSFEERLISIQNLRLRSNNEDLDLSKRVELAEKALELSFQHGQDSTILLSNRNLAYLYLLSSRLPEHRKASLKNLQMATKAGDSLVMAYTYENLGYNYLADRVHDSAFYYYDRALRHYQDLDQEEKQIDVLINLTKIFSDEKDYFGSEQFAVQGLSILENLAATENNLNSKLSLYSLMASNFNEMDMFETSLEYYSKALEVTDQMKNGFWDRFDLFNDIADVYIKKKDYDTALEYYNRVFNEERVFQMDPSFYPLILVNIARTRYLKGDPATSEIEEMLKNAYRISDSLENRYVKLTSTYELAELYKGENQIDAAQEYAFESYNLAKEITDTELLLKSMLLLSQVHEGEKSNEYLNEFIQLNDSLLQRERSTRNKFARIMFETDQLEQENVRISQQRQWLIFISLGLLLTSFLIYIIITQRAKNKELQLIQDQQKANEEIYNLMLSQQDKVEEARANEKKRISQEIHDGVLGRMFGIRLSLDSLNFNSGPEAIKNRAQYISELKTVEDDMRKISHDLSTDFVSGAGFADILQELIEKQTAAFDLDYQFDHSDEINWEFVPNKTKINLYRIIQETLQNIYKHAEAQKVWISLLLKNDVIYLSIRDDGKGFDVQKSKKGIGIKNITSRVKEIEGKLKLNSIINQGTSTEIEVPYHI